MRTLGDFNKDSKRNSSGLIEQCKFNIGHNQIGWAAMS